MNEIKKDCLFCKPSLRSSYIFYCDVEKDNNKDITSEGCRSNCMYYCTQEEAKEIVKTILSVRIK